MSLAELGMTTFVSHIPVDVAVTRATRPHHIDIKEHHHRPSDSNASFLRAARAGNVDKVLEYLKGSIDINTSNANGLNALHLASKEGHVAVVTELVKRGANVNAATKKGNTALHIASLAGQEEVVKILIRSSANANVQSQNGFTPLYMAAQENHDGVVKFLLANGANQSLATEDGFTPLAVALQQGHDKVVAVLLENDAKGRVRLPALHIAAKKDDCKAAALLLQNDHDPDVTSKSGFTPLHIAAHYGNENIATLLLEKNADVNYSAKHQITPLHVAAKWGKSNMVTLLIDKGGKIDASTRDGLTPLHCAARSGHDQVVDLLLEKGAPITAKTKNGLAPLHMASQGDHVDSARILLYHKAPVDDVTVDYLTALHVAAHCGHVRVAKLLLDRKADPNARALNGFTPLHIACKKNRIKVVELLLKHGASIEATTESGLTPLHVASFMGCMNIVIYLIQHGANPDVPTVRGETPLHLAARANQSDIIRILLRNGAHVDASAREQQTPLHIAARLGNVDIVGLLLQHGAAVDATTKDMYTALHIAAKEGQEEVASVLLDHGASLTATTKKGFTPLHLAAKYGNIKVATLLLQKDAPVDAQGKNGVTPLHVAAHYDHVNVALLLLDKGAFPHATAKNGYTPLHIAAKKNQMDIATTLLEYGAKPSAESKAGFAPLHLAAQEGHTDMTTLLIEHHADVNSPAKNGLSPLHLCSQEDKVNVAAILVKNGAKIDPQTKAGYTPLHVACHFGQINMIRFLLQHGADVNATTSHGYTPLHQAAQQGHTLIINLLLEHKASPNTTTNQGQTALSIAQRLGYISVVETLKIVTETIVTTTTTTVTEEKYKVVAPETMQETFMSDSEDEGAEDTMLGDQSLHYMTTDELKALADDNTLGIDVTRDERGTDSTLIAPLTAEEDHLTPQHVVHQEATFSSSVIPDNVDLSRAPVHAGFLVSFMVDARGGAMRGCRHSGVRVIIPPRKAPMPMRITCRYLRKEKLAYPPPLMEGEACASRILEVGPSGAKFLGPVIIEVPHFASLRGREREITILRSDNGETWREHTLEASDDAVHDVFNESFEGEELTAIEDLSTNRITRILTTDFPQYFAIITRIRQEVHAIGPEGGMVSSTVVPQVQAIFPEGALTKKIKVGLQAQPITPELVTKLLGNRVAVSPIVTVEPRRRKFHKPITLTIPVPQAATKGMINQYSGDAPTLRLLCSITGGTTKAQWEDVTGSTPLTFVNDCVSFTTTVSARFWLMDCRQVNEATKFATELYREAIHVPFMAKFVVFAKRHDPLEAQLRVFCMTDDKEDKTLESQEHFTEVAKSRDVEVLEGKPQYLEFAGNLIPVTKSGEQLSLTFQAFRENRLPFTIRVKDPHQEPMGRVAFMREQRVGRGEPPQQPICNLNIVLPEADLTPVSELVTLEKKYGFVKETSLAKPELIHRADLRLSDIAKELKEDWVLLALQLDLPESDINTIRSENPGDATQQALIMLRHWLQRSGSRPTGNMLEKGLRKINREDIVKQCMFNVELVTDDVEKAVAKVHLDQSGFDTFKEELGSSRDASLRRETSLNGTYDEQDIMKDAESAAETSSESSEKEAHFRPEARHPQRTEEREITEDVSRTSAKELEEGPETLVQNVPTALAESFTQHMSNGQMSDASLHEEDKSEPTAATLSSEATAEMEVSSLEEKSQTETRVEKKVKASYYGTAKDSSRLEPTINIDFPKVLVKETPHNVKLRRQFKKDGCLEIAKKKAMSDIYLRTMTPPASFKKKKLVSRRNSWPTESPKKLNKRKKYQQRLKVRDVLEPLFMDTYEWLVSPRQMPEELKLAPLASFTEFEERESNTNFNSEVKYSYPLCKKIIVPSAENRSQKLSVMQLKPVDALPFYFIKDVNKRFNFKDDKNYLQNLKNRCLYESIKSCTVRSLKPTSFIDVAADTQNSNIMIDDLVTTKCHVISPFRNATSFIDVDFEPDAVTYNEMNDYSFNDSAVLQDYYRQIYVPVPRSSQRPLQSLNNDGDVLVQSSTINFDNHLNVKQKLAMKNNFYNKENVAKSSSISFPNSKFSDHTDKLKKPVTSFAVGKNLKQSQRINPKFDLLGNRDENFGKHLNDAFNSGREFSSLIKNSQIKSNKQDTVGCIHQDMNDPNSPESKKEDVKEKCSSETSAPSKSSESASTDSDNKCSNLCSAVKDSSTSESLLPGSSQGNRPHARQLFEQDIQSNFSKSSKKMKDEKKTDKSEEEKNKFDESEKDTIEFVDDSQEFAECSSEKSSQSSHTTSLEEHSLKSVQEQVHKEPVKETQVSASIIGQMFLSALLEEQNKVQDILSSTSKPIPASVIGQSFLKTLVQEQSVEETMKESTIPASVIGQTFLKNLITSQDESSTSVVNNGKNDSDVSTPSEDGHSTKDQPLPASVIGQTFLKTLIDSECSTQVPNLPKPIPATVIGQSFLKSLSEQKSHEEEHESSKPVTPAAVVGQTFLKALVESAKSEETKSDDISQTVPAAAVSQAFLKALLTQYHDTQEVKTEEAIPASVIGQSFLKTLIDQQSTSQHVTEEASKPIPGTVVGQAFLKSLLQQNVTDTESKQVLPASVVGQAFLRTLFECQNVDQKYNTKATVQQAANSDQKPIPASVIGQTFLKELMQQSVPADESSKEHVIPAPVVGQAFLKTLVESQNLSQKSDSGGVSEHVSSIKPVQSSVIGQAFLKNLVQQGSVSDESSKQHAIPAPVVSLAFLKTLMESQNESSLYESGPLTHQQASHSEVIPSSVISQAFLKSLAQETASSDVSSKEQVIPASVVGQSFLKTLVECENLDPKCEIDKQAAGSNIIPSNVVGQTFLKMLVQQGEGVDESRKEHVIPATVVEQAFLKSLVESQNITQSPDTDIAAGQTPNPVPSTVIGQAFIRTLQQSVSGNESSEEQVISAAVVGQSFLKTLVESQKYDSGVTADPDSSQKPIPSSVIGQTFLKTLVQQSDGAGESSKEQIIPAPVIGQAFLKTLMECQSDDQKCETDTKTSQQSLSVIPSTVIGQSFLKTLMQQGNDTHESSKEQVIPANVVEQTFLKTLIDSQNYNNSGTTEYTPSTSVVPSAVIGQTFLKTLLEEGAGAEKSSKGYVIPAPVVGQAFLKTLVECKTDGVKDTTTTTATTTTTTGPSTASNISPEVIPGSVIGQTFLKTLVQQSSVDEASNQQVIPATVIGQTFLKTLQNLGESSEKCELGKSVHSSAELGCFKSCDEENLQIAEAKEESDVHLAARGQSPLELIQEEEKAQKHTSNVIPATVVGQSFLKMLAGEHEHFARTESKEVPASVIGQVFLKTLIQTESECSEAQVNKPIPAPVIGQTFLKSLLEEQTEMPDSAEGKVAPASVVGQAFLKTLPEQGKVASGESQKPIPSSVVGQTFLKSLIGGVCEEKSIKEQVIPSSVVGQAFLKSLSEETSQISSIHSQTSESISDSAEHPSVAVSEKEKSEIPIPASVVGLAFLKTLNEHASKELGDKASDEDNSVVKGTDDSHLNESDKSIPASVVGQAFLKTLLSMTDKSNSLPVDILAKESQNTSKKCMDNKCGGQSSKSEGTDHISDLLTSELQHHGDGDESGTSQNVASAQSFISKPELSCDEECTIIPPPPEFSSDDTKIPSSDSASQASSSTLKPPISTSPAVPLEVTPGIIGELLSCTKMMQSVIESMKESDTEQTSSTGCQIQSASQQDSK